jgi:hypothetical protein
VPPSASATATAPPTVTPTGAVAAVDVGVLSGATGAIVAVPVTLATNGAQVAAVANDIEYDSTSVEVVVTSSGPDCTIDPRLAASKQLHASVADLGGGRARLRVGVIGRSNNALIADGRLYSCRFRIDADIGDAVTLLNTPEISGPQANALPVVGDDGRIDVVAPPPALGLSAGTATAGGTSLVVASLQARTAAIAALSTDIEFMTSVLDVAEVGGEPDCAVTAEAAALDKELRAIELPAGAGRAVLRVGLFGRDNNTALPTAGTVALFRCRFRVLSGTTGTVMLEHVPAGAAPNAQPVTLDGQPGSITVQ